MTNAVQAIDQEKAAALAAGAQAGSAGIAAYQQAAAQVAATRDAALKATASNAALINAGGAATNDLNAIVRSGADRRLGDIAQAQGTFGADQAAANARQGRWTGMMQGALPTLQELGRQKGESDANRVLEKAAKAAQQKELSDSAERVRLMGAAQLQRDQALQPLAARGANLDKQLKPISKRQTAIQKALASMAKIPKDGHGSKLVMRGNVRKVRGRLEKELAGLAKKRAALERDAEAEMAMPLSERARAIGLEQGLAPERVYGLVGPKEDAQYANAGATLQRNAVPEPDKVIARSANVDAATLRKIRGGTIYAKVKKELLGELDAGKTWDEVEPLLRELLVRGDITPGKKRYPRTYRVIEAEFQRLFPTLAAQEKLAYADTSG